MSIVIADQTRQRRHAEPLLVHERAHPKPAQTSDESLQIVMFPARMFLALGWLRAGTEKLIDFDWWTGHELEAFLVTQRGHALPFARVAIDQIFLPTRTTIALAVMLAQFGIGLAFLSARHMRPALAVAMTLNLTFVSLGAVTPSAFYLVLQLTLLAGLREQMPEQSNQRRGWRAGVCLVAAAAVLPFAQTIRPEEVIDDPALMLATIGVLCASVDLLRIASLNMGGSDRSQQNR